MTTEMSIVRFWHFHCPECGFGDGELGYLAEAHEVHCTVCLVESSQYVRLRRWESDESASGGGNAEADISRAA